MVPRQYTARQLRLDIVCDALGDRELFLRGGLSLLVGVVGAVEGREALEVAGRPGVLALQKLVDFALGGGAAGDGGLVVFFGGADGGAGRFDDGLWSEWGGLAKHWG